MTQATVVEIRGKTEQRVQMVIASLKAAKDPLTYEDLQQATGSTYDSLLYILATLAEVGLIERKPVSTGSGRPRVYFRWTGMVHIKAQALGA